MQSSTKNTISAMNGIYIRNGTSLSIDLHKEISNFAITSSITMKLYTIVCWNVCEYRYHIQVYNTVQYKYEHFIKKTYSEYNIMPIAYIISKYSGTVGTNIYSWTLLCVTFLDSTCYQRAFDPQIIQTFSLQSMQCFFLRGKVRIY